MTDQEKREKVIKGLGAVKETLEDMRDKLGVEWCEDAIALLKAQEPASAYARRSVEQPCDRISQRKTARGWKARIHGGL